MKNCHVLIADDDVATVKLVRTNLEARGYKISVARNGNEAIEEFGKICPDLVILDIMMPMINGKDVCSRIREWSDVPIIMLTALSEIDNKLECFNIGADDYLVKPFSIDELLARIRAVLRRSIKKGASPVSEKFTDGNLVVDFGKRKVTLANREIKLTPTEYHLLKELILNSSKVLTHTQLLHSIWGLEYAQEKEYIRVYINHLRKKLNSISYNYIKTVPGVGYIFDCLT